MIRLAQTLDKLGFSIIKERTLRYCKSELGSMRIQDVLPSTSRERVVMELARTHEMIQVLQSAENYPSETQPDIRSYLKHARMEGSILAITHFLELLTIATLSRRTRSFLKQREEQYPQLFAIAQLLIPMKDLETHIQSIITDRGELKNDASDELQRIRKSLSSKRNQLRSAIQKTLKRAQKDGMSGDEGATIRNGRMVIPIQAEYKRKIPGFVHDVSATGQTVYLEPAEALHLNNDIRELEIEEQKEIERILRALTDHVRMYLDWFSGNIEYLSELDAIYAKARLSLEINASVPLMAEDGVLHLKKAYNPLLIIKQKDPKTDPIIPLDLRMEPDERCLMITGPNAGGKSVAMKTIGLSTVMVQCGWGIPADPNSELPVMTGWFIDMGDDQSIENDLSTFSSRLQWMRFSSEKAKSDALVLIDEAAAGTDPEEGGALFQSFIEEMLERNTLSIVTTHHGSLKVFAHEHPKAVNGSMEFDQQHLAPTYHFKKGIPGSSYAFDIAQRMQLSDTLLSRAREVLGSQKNTLESLISEMEHKTQEATRLEEEMKRLQDKAIKQKRTYEHKMESLYKEKAAIREKALKEAKLIMEGANKKVEQAVQQIVEEKKTKKKDLKNLRAQLSDHREDIEQSLAQIEQKKADEIAFQVSKKPPKVGDFVRFLDGQTHGELVELKGKQAVVQTDGLRLKTTFKNLIRVEAPKKSPSKKKTLKIDSLQSPIPLRLDIRGKRADDALQEVRDYLDKALFRGLQQVEIVHGKGDGILKDVIHTYLQDRSDIPAFQLANEDQGGAGCTMVQLA
jgi:DNA mismatch repair protein MutS2